MRRSSGEATCWWFLVLYSPILGFTWEETGQIGMALSTLLANLHLFLGSFVVSLASFHVLLSCYRSAELHISSRTLCPSSPATQDGWLRWSPTPGSCWEFWPRYRLLCLCSVRCSPLCDGGHGDSTPVNPDSMCSKACVPFSVAA